MDSQGYLALCYAISVVLVVAMAGYAFFLGYLWRRKITSTEDFITARGQVSTGACVHLTRRRDRSTAPQWPVKCPTESC